MLGAVHSMAFSGLHVCIIFEDVEVRRPKTEIRQ